eukprot:1150166-Pelagomonas_calceolata.AAC.1
MFGQLSVVPAPVYMVSQCCIGAYGDSCVSGAPVQMVSGTPERLPRSHCARFQIWLNWIGGYQIEQCSTNILAKVRIIIIGQHNAISLGGIRPRRLRKASFV